MGARLSLRLSKMCYMLKSPRHPDLAPGKTFLRAFRSYVMMFTGTRDESCSRRTRIRLRSLGYLVMADRLGGSTARGQFTWLLKNEVIFLFSIKG
jgi:hypothetical protein